MCVFKHRNGVESFDLIFYVTFAALKIIENEDNLIQKLLQKGLMTK